MIRFKHQGDLKKTKNFLNESMKVDLVRLLERCGQQGVEALRSSTPKDTGEAANSWAFEIRYAKNSISLVFTNSKMAGNVPLVILIQYGHATRNGGFVIGNDFINPALRPLFDNLADNAWKEITKR